MRVDQIGYRYHNASGVFVRAQSVRLYKDFLEKRVRTVRGTWHAIRPSDAPDTLGEEGSTLCGVVFTLASVGLEFVSEAAQAALEGKRTLGRQFDIPEEMMNYAHVETSSITCPACAHIIMWAKSMNKFYAPSSLKKRTHLDGSAYDQLLNGFDA